MASAPQHENVLNVAAAPSLLGPQEVQATVHPGETPGAPGAPHVAHSPPAAGASQFKQAKAALFSAQKAAQGEQEVAGQEARVKQSGGPVKRTLTLGEAAREPSQFQQARAALSHSGSLMGEPPSPTPLGCGPAIQGKRKCKGPQAPPNHNMHTGSEAAVSQFREAKAALTSRVLGAQGGLSNPASVLKSLPERQHRREPGGRSQFYAARTALQVGADAAPAALPTSAALPASQEKQSSCASGSTQFRQAVAALRSSGVQLDGTPAGSEGGDSSLMGGGAQAGQTRKHVWPTKEALKLLRAELGAAGGGGDEGHDSRESSRRRESTQFQAAKAALALWEEEVLKSGMRKSSPDWAGARPSSTMAAVRSATASLGGDNSQEVSQYRKALDALAMWQKQMQEEEARASAQAAHLRAKHASQRFRGGQLHSFAAESRPASAHSSPSPAAELGGSQSSSPDEQCRELGNQESNALEAASLQFRQAMATLLSRDMVDGQACEPQKTRPSRAFQAVSPECCELERQAQMVSDLCACPADKGGRLDRVATRNKRPLCNSQGLMPSSQGPRGVEPVAGTTSDSLRRSFSVTEGAGRDVLRGRAASELKEAAGILEALARSVRGRELVEHKVDKNAAVKQLLEDFPGEWESYPTEALHRSVSTPSGHSAARTREAVDMFAQWDQVRGGSVETANSGTESAWPYSPVLERGNQQVDRRLSSDQSSSQSAEPEELHQQVLSESSNEGGALTAVARRLQYDVGPVERAPDSGEVSAVSLSAPVLEDGSASHTPKGGSVSECLTAHILGKRFAEVESEMQVGGIGEDAVEGPLDRLRKKVELLKGVEGCLKEQLNSLSSRADLEASTVHATEPQQQEVLSGTQGEPGIQAGTNLHMLGKDPAPHEIVPLLPCDDCCSKDIGQQGITVNAPVEKSYLHKWKSAVVGCGLKCSLSKWYDEVPASRQVDRVMARHRGWLGHR